VRELTWLTQAVHSGKKTRRPEPYPRPGGARGQRDVVEIKPTETFETPDEFNAWRESRFALYR
jgi:hypothetical protein